MSHFGGTSSKHFFFLFPPLLASSLRRLLRNSIRLAEPGHTPSSRPDRKKEDVHGLTKAWSLFGNSFRGAVEALRGVINTYFERNTRINS